MYPIHIFPAVAFCMNAMVTRFTPCRDHWRFFMPVAILYAIVNYKETKRSGKPLYFFLTWEDWTSPAICFGLTVFFCVIWIGICEYWPRIFGTTNATKTSKTS